MKKTISSHKVFFISITLFFLFILFIGTNEVEYSLRAPGFNDHVEDFLILETENEESGSFHTTSVIAVDKITTMQYMFGNMMKKVDIKDFPIFYQSTDLKDLTVMGRLQKDDSLSSALIVSIEKAGYEIEYTTYNTVFLVFLHLTPNTVEIGDYILEVNGSTSFYDELRDTECGQSADIKVLRDGEELTFTITKNLEKQNEPEGDCSFGLYIDTLSEIQSTEVEYTIKKLATQGPSGGLLQTLYIYNKLTEFDYSRGLKIGGTGTIDVYGNVGPIGSVRQKVITSIANGIDVFFVPYLSDNENDNYIEAMRVLEEFNTDMEVVGVKTFDEAIEYLENYGEDNE
jgi:PDZ domain-containing protein